MSVRAASLRCSRCALRSCRCAAQVAEHATQIFITNDRPNVAGLILAGSADFKTELSQSDLFDPRLQAVVLGVVDVSYGARASGVARHGRVCCW